MSGWRRSIAAVVVVVAVLATWLALRWIWRDITYWSRSVTFTYGTDSLETCVRRAALNLPGVSATTAGIEIALHVPGQEGVIVKPTARPQVARLVVYGHSPSVSTLGPSSEGSVMELLDRLARELTEQCRSARPARHDR